AGGVDGVLGDLPPWSWLLAWMLPGAVWLLWRRPRALAADGAGAPALVLSRLGRLEREFQGVLANHVVDPETRDGDGLARALRAAADSFAARAAAEPQIAAHWYDLGATLYRAGADGKATAAWTLAARLAPRNALVRRARRLLPPPDAASESLLAVGPATPAEGWLAATAAGGLACGPGIARPP